MSQNSRGFGCVAALILAVVICGTSFAIVLEQIFPRLPGRPQSIERIPLPHHVPKYDGGTSLRLAMVHDTIHERYAVHGSTYYQHRNELTRAALKKEKDKFEGDSKKATSAYFALLDDLGVGLEKLGQSKEAAELLSEKLALQEKQGLEGRELYTTYANLGTFLAHWQFQIGFSNQLGAKARLETALGYIRKSIEVNPQAHFGRELWQAVTFEFALARLDHPELLLKYDMVGNRLVRRVDPTEGSCSTGVGPRNYHQFSNTSSLTDELRSNVRKHITQVGAERDWAAEVTSSHNKPVPFDEPTLGIIGMWRMGGGANPHFALALGEIMLRVGQRSIAWTAYERAVLLAPKFSPEPEVRSAFVRHCRDRQKSIEVTLPEREVADLRPRFVKELEFGQGFQTAYQEYEARKINEGADINDPHFDDAFCAQRGPIASGTGDEEYMIRARPPGLLPELVLLIGLGVLAGGGILRLLDGQPTPSRSKP